MVGNGLVGDFQLVGPLNGNFLEQKGGHPPIHALPHKLLHPAHDLRKPAGHQIVGVICHRGGLSHQLLVNFGRYAPKLCILFCLDSHLKLDGADDTGGTEQAYITVKQAIDGNFPPIF